MPPAAEITSALQALQRRLTVTVGGVDLPFERPSRPNFDRVHAVTASVRDEQGIEGFGHAICLNKERLDAAVAAAVSLMEFVGPDAARLIDVERLELMHFGAGSNLASRSAACAISLAMWDLLGRRLGVSCAELWGQRRSALPCYTGSFFATAETKDLKDAARKCLEANFHACKMRLGLHSVAEDIERVSIVQQVLGPGKVGADPVFRWKPEQANEFLAHIKTPMLWLEDPSEYARIGEVKGTQPIAAGEISGTLDELIGLATKGVSVLLIDLGVIGGPARFLEAARALTGLGLRVGSHAYPYYSVHALATVPGDTPVEVLEWGDAFYVDRPRPDRTGAMSPRGPGFGVEVNRKFLDTRQSVREFRN